MDHDDAGDAPLLRVVAGDPTPEEVAALVTVLVPRLRAAAPEPARGPSRWVRSTRPRSGHGGLPVAPGPDAWRAAALPR